MQAIKNDMTRFPLLTYQIIENNGFSQFELFMK